MSQEIITVQNVRGYCDKEGTAWLNAEDVARGLGFTEEKNGVEYIKWRRVNEYLQGFGFSPQVAKDDFIPENMFYRLAMKAKNETAEVFQAKIADEILPAIRKTGFYSAKPMTATQILIMTAKALEEQEQRLAVVENNVSTLTDSLSDIIDRLDHETSVNAYTSCALEAKDKQQQDQLDRHEEDIDVLKQNMFDMLRDKTDITQDLDIFIKDLVSTYECYQVLGPRTRYKTAWSDFYKAIAEEADKPNPEGYIMSLVNRQRERQIKGGIAKTTAQKNVTGKSIINSVPELKNAAIAVMTRVMVDIKNHEEEDRMEQ